MSGIGQGTWWGLPRRCTLYGSLTERTQKQFNSLIRPKQTSRVGKCRSMLTWPGSTSSKVAPGVARTALAMASITCITYMSSTGGATFGCQNAVVSATTLTSLSFPSEKFGTHSIILAIVPALLCLWLLVTCLPARACTGTGLYWILHMLYCAGRQTCSAPSDWSQQLVTDWLASTSTCENRVFIEIVNTQHVPLSLLYC